MDPPPVRRPASNSRRGRRRRKRRGAGTAASTGAGADVPETLGGPAPSPGAAAAPSSRSSRRRDRRRRRRERNRAAKAAAEASKDPEACVPDAVSMQGDSVLQAGYCLEAVEALQETTTKALVNSNKTRKRNFQVGNDATKVSEENGVVSSSLARENSAGELAALRTKLFKYSDVSCPCNNFTALENAGTNIDYQNRDPKCPEMKNTDLSGNLQEAYHKTVSADCSSLQELGKFKENENEASINSSNLKEEKKERRKKRGGKRHNHRKRTSSHVPPLLAGINSSGLMTMVSENNTSRLKPKGRRKKRVRNEVSVTSSVSVDKVNTTEGESMNLDSAIEKRSELGRSNLECTNTDRNEQQEQDVVCLSKDYNVDCLNPSSLAEAYMEKLKIIFSTRLSFVGFPKRKLLILDLNGLLADINQEYHDAHMADAKVRGKLVFRRPYCDDFLKFCAQNFDLGIWSSRKKENVASVVNIVMRDFKPRLLFCWDMSKCTFTGRKTLENKHKPLVLKELRKLWNKEEPDLPWEEGDYSPLNTLLVDDSPYKALRNPLHTAIFPRPYTYLNSNDNSLGPGGDLRVYLQNLAVADDVECYVRNNPFGQPFITESDPHWNFYAEIVDRGSTPLNHPVRVQ